MRLDHLNDKQREAVLATEGPVLIIAGAGSGKTSVLTYRIAHILEMGVMPYNILALTFTNKAASEMRHRIEQLVGEKAKDLWMGTFHGVFLKILKIEVNHIGYSSNFSIYDSEEAKSMIGSIIKDLELNTDIYKSNYVASRISSMKSKLIDAKSYILNTKYVEHDQSANLHKFAEIYRIYEERIKNSNAMDFDDIIFNFYRLVKNNSNILEKYQNLFKYILVDEFQDTNVAQYEILKVLARLNNLTAVGDDSQSIYAFRGASVQNILSFERDFNSVKIIKLEQNYRSTKTIIGIANSVISHNKNQIEKNIWTDNLQGDIVNVVRANSEVEEAFYITNSILDIKNKTNSTFRDFVVLCRTNSQSRSLEEACRKSGIPYKVVGGLSFYQRKEVKDVLAYLRLISNLHDEESLKRIINIPKRGIGTNTLDKLTRYATERRISVWEAIMEADNILEGQILKRIIDFRNFIEKYSMLLERFDAYTIATEIVKESGLIKELFEDKTPEGKTRYDNVQELINSIKIFTESFKDDNTLKSISDFLQEIALYTTADASTMSNDYVSLMTIHSSKGLEFDYVFIAGLEEELFPSTQMLYSKEDLEEERRLFYVAVTRAKKKLFMSYALSRYKFGKIKSSIASRFITEIDPNFLFHTDKSSQASIHHGYGTDKKKSSFSKYFQTNASTTASSTVALPIKKDGVSNDKLSIGTHVIHPKFSVGIVVALDLNIPSPRVIVKFKNFGEKTLLLEYACLQIVERH